MDESTSTEKTLIHHDWDKEDYGEYRRKIVRESQRKRRAKARTQGLCLICAKNPAAEGYTACAECYSRVLKWHGRQRNEKQSI